MVGEFVGFHNKSFVPDHHINVQYEIWGEYLRMGFNRLGFTTHNQSLNLTLNNIISTRNSNIIISPQDKT
jgi:hypothetical protein